MFWIGNTILSSNHLQLIFLHCFCENELDIRGLFRTLWAGKLWIIGMGLAFALIALAYTFFARQCGIRAPGKGFLIVNGGEYFQSRGITPVLRSRQGTHRIQNRLL
uniref:Wzz/FepE/Etk N-terminal domain-containing protein n=1 Tax=Escherichia coli TaxID=562 RepID=UPI0020778AB5